MCKSFNWVKVFIQLVLKAVYRGTSAMTRWRQCCATALVQLQDRPSFELTLNCLLIDRSFSTWNLSRKKAQVTATLIVDWNGKRITKSCNLIICVFFLPYFYIILTIICVNLKRYYLKIRFVILSMSSENNSNIMIITFPLACSKVSEFEF